MVCFSLSYLRISEHSTLTTNISPGNCAAVRDLGIEVEAHRRTASKDTEIKRREAWSSGERARESSQRRGCGVGRLGLNQHAAFQALPECGIGTCVGDYKCQKCVEWYLKQNKC